MPITSISLGIRAVFSTGTLLLVRLQCERGGYYPHGLDIQAALHFCYSPQQCVCVCLVASDFHVSPQKVTSSKPLCSPRSCSLLNGIFGVAIYTQITSSALTLGGKRTRQSPGIIPAGNFRLIFLSSTYSSRLFSDGDSKMYCMACYKFLAGCLN